MIHSMMDTDIWDEEFELVLEQDHFEEVWAIIEQNLAGYIDGYLDAVAVKNHKFRAEENWTVYVNDLIRAHTKEQDAYESIFAPDLMDEYEEDVDGFKGSVLSRQCPTIRQTLNSKREALKEWQILYKLRSPRELYDTFYNMITFAEDYDSKMADELVMVDSIEDIGLRELPEEACYLRGVIGTGILSTVLNAMYPHLFPGQFKLGLFTLCFLSGRAPIGMRSESSEFIMVKDHVRSKTGIIEAEHNYFYPYCTFALYSLRIVRELEIAILDRFNARAPEDFRYVLTNDFYRYVVNENKDAIATLTGNDDALKYGFSI